MCVYIERRDKKKKIIIIKYKKTLHEKRNRLPFEKWKFFLYCRFQESGAIEEKTTFRGLRTLNNTVYLQVTRKIDRDL